MSEISHVIAKNLTKTFHTGVVKKDIVRAVKKVSLSIQKGKTLGLAGDSGCGKSTVARMILRLIPCDSGEIYFNGNLISSMNQKEFRYLRKKMQILFQHPESAFDPRKKMLYTLMEPMKIHNLYSSTERVERIQALLKLVGVHEKLLSRYPHQISGGEAQRLAIARALTLSPEFIILDEPTSMLDVSIQAHVLNILRDLQKQFNLTYLFISHDIDVLKWFCDDISVMNQGEIVETGTSEAIVNNPKNAYTKKLIEHFYNW